MKPEIMIAARGPLLQVCRVVANAEKDTKRRQRMCALVDVAERNKNVEIAPAFSRLVKAGGQ